MTTDPDILAIRRRRRQEGRCLACGARVPRTALCGTCRARLAYCPVCETVYPRRAGLDPRRATEYCRACMTLAVRKRTGARSYDRYLADVQALRHRVLPEILRRYARGENLTSVAHVLGLTRSQIDRIIRDARLRSEWPAELRRYRKRENS